MLNNNNSNNNNMPGNYDNLSFMSLLASGTSNTSTTTNNTNNNNNNNTNNNSTNNLSGSPSQQQLISSSATIPSNNSSNSLYQSVPYGPHPRIPTTSTTTTAATNNTNATTSIPTPHTPQQQQQQQQQQALLMMPSAGTSLDPSSLAAHHHHHPHAHAAHFNALSHTHPVHHHHHHPALHAHAAHTHHHATAAHHHHHHHPQFSHLQTGGHQPQPRFTSSAAAIMAARYQQYQHYHLYDHGSACSCCEPIIKPPNSHMTLMTQSSSGSNLASLTASNSPQQQQQQQQQQQAAAQQPLKSPNSCRQCRASHRRCDRLLPSCTQCLKRKVAVTCVYEPLKTQQSSTASSKDKDSASVANNSNNNNTNTNTTTTTSTATATATTTVNNGGTCCDDHETGGDEKSPSTGGLQHSSSSPSLSDGNNKKMQQQKKKRYDASSNNGNGGSSNGSSSSSNKRQKMQDDSTEEEQSTTNSSVSPSSPPSTSATIVDQQQQQNMAALQRSASSSSLSGLSGSVNDGGATMPSTSPTRNNNNHFGSSSNLVSQAQQTTIFDGSQVEQYVMEHPSVATASLDVNNGGGSGGGHSGPLKLNALSSSSHQILDGCFQLVSPKEMGIHSDEFEHNLIAQFLYNKTIPNHLFHPQNENSLDQQAFLDQKASQALWFAFQAIALQQLPAMEKSPFVNTAQETRLCERVLEKLLYSMVNIKRNVSSLVQLMCKFPRTLLMQASRNMCRLAEQILLDPKIFPFIGKHMVLAQACCFLVFYLLVIGEQPEEAAVFLKAVKVYADREQRVLDIAPANVTNIISRQQLQTQQMVIQGLIDAYAAMKSALWFNSAAPKQNDFHTKKSLHKFIKLSLQAALVGSSYSSDSRLVLLKQHECLKRLKDILDNGDDTKDQLYRFLLTCQEMRRDVTNLPVESFMNTIWHIYVFNFEVFALEIAAAQLNCDFAQLQSIQVNLANEIAQEWLNCLPVVISSGARSMNLLKFISRVHIQHSVQLCSNMNVSFEDTEILMEALKFLQIDIIILDAIHNKYGVTKYKEMSDQVKIQEQIHKRFMAQTLGLQVDNVVPLPQSAASTPYNVPLPPSSSSSALAPTTDNVEGPTSSSSSSSVGPTTTTTTAAASSSNSIPMHENTGGLLPEQHRPMISQPMNESLFMDLFNWQGY